MQLISPKCISVVEAAKALGVSRTVAFALIASRQLRAIKIGRRTVVPISSLEQFIEHSAQEAASGPGSARR